MSHVVTISRSFGPSKDIMADAKAFATALMEWADANCSEAATLPLTRVKQYGSTGKASFDFEFERQEDATLFKLFWS